MLLYSPFWWFALRAAVYHLNRIPTRKTKRYTSPYECLRKSPPIFASAYGDVMLMCLNSKLIGPNTLMPKRMVESLWVTESRR